MDRPCGAIFGVVFQSMALSSAALWHWIPDNATWTASELMWAITTKRKAASFSAYAGKYLT